MIFNLHSKTKKDLKWHDGKPLTADDLVFTMKQIMDENKIHLLEVPLLLMISL